MISVAGQAAAFSSCASRFACGSCPSSACGVEVLPLKLRLAEGTESCDWRQPAENGQCSSFDGSPTPRSLWTWWGHSLSAAWRLLTQVSRGNQVWGQRHDWQKWNWDHFSVTVGRLEKVFLSFRTSSRTSSSTVTGRHQHCMNSVWTVILFLIGPAHPVWWYLTNRNWSEFNRSHCFFSSLYLNTTFYTQKLSLCVYICTAL